MWRQKGVCIWGTLSPRPPARGMMPLDPRLGCVKACYSQMNWGTKRLEEKSFFIFPIVFLSMSGTCALAPLYNGCAGQGGLVRGWPGIGAVGNAKQHNGFMLFDFAIYSVARCRRGWWCCWRCWYGWRYERSGITICESLQAAGHIKRERKPRVFIVKIAPNSPVFQITTSPSDTCTDICACGSVLCGEPAPNGLCAARRKRPSGKRQRGGLLCREREWPSPSFSSF